MSEESPKSKPDANNTDSKKKSKKASCRCGIGVWLTNRDTFFEKQQLRNPGHLTNPSSTIATPARPNLCDVKTISEMLAGLAPESFCAASVCGAQSHLWQGELCVVSSGRNRTPVERTPGRGKSCLESSGETPHDRKEVGNSKTPRANPH
jgi:hypothetical protein